MPPVEKHYKTSTDRTGNEYREIHEWLDNDPEMKAERHDITKIYDNSKMIEEKYGIEGRQEYIRHLHDDVRTKFEHLQHDLENSLKETLAYFGIR